MRKMASIRKIDDIQPIVGADAIEVAIVGGWNVVVKKGEYNSGDFAIYCEIDSWIPNHIAPFLSKGKEPREYNGVKGERLKTVRLRGQLSQGLLLPIETLPRSLGFEYGVTEGEEVTQWLNIQKWEAPVSAQLAGNARGNFPTAVPKTDQERIQNLKRQFEDWKAEPVLFEVTEKLDGSSCTFYLDLEGDFHVCSRNLDLTKDENNTFWKMALKYDVEARMRERGLLGVALQGEVIGEGIQGNQYKIQGHQFFLFDVFNVKTGNYLDSGERNTVTAVLGLNHAPVIGFKHITAETIADILIEAEGKSVLNGSEREGLVWKAIGIPGVSFKTISNRWLIRNDD